MTLRPRACVTCALLLVAGCGDPPAATDGTASSSGSTGATGDTTGSTTVTPTTEGPTDITITTITTTTTTTTPGTVTVTMSEPTTTTISSDPTDTIDTTVDPSDSDTDATTGPVQMFTPLALELQDFDGDGEHDLLVMGVDNFDGTVGRLSRGVGDGSFMPALDAGLAGASAFPVVGELDGTPGVDVMVAQPDGDVEVFRWSGEAFTSWMVFANDNAPRTHAVADADDDGDDDIVWLWWTKDSVEFGLSVRPHEGGAFLAPVDSTLGPVAEFAPGSLVVGRFDAGPAADALVFQADQPQGLLRLLGGDAGVFGQPKVVLPTLRPWVAATGDFNEDGNLDVLLVERTPGRLVVITGDGAGGFKLGPDVPIAGPFVPFTIAVADLDANGHLDVAVVDDQQPELRLWAGTGKGTFAGPLVTPLPAPAVRVLAAPLDDDAKADLVAATFAAGEVTILLSP